MTRHRTVTRHLEDALDHARAANDDAALDALARLACEPPDFRSWVTADRLLATLRARGAVTRWARRTARVAVVSSHTSAQLAASLRVGALAHGLDAITFETGYRTYEQAVVDPGSQLYSFAPDVVVLVVDHRELRLPEVSADPVADVAAEVARWTGLWTQLRDRTGAVVVQTTFVPPADDALGNVGATLPGGRRRMIRSVNAALQDAAPAGVYLVDAELVAAEIGLKEWFDPRYWFASKHAVGLGAVGPLAARVIDVVAAALGLARKVVVLDLDNTLWGGAIGEDGLGGIVLGDGAVGEAFTAFQTYVGSLRRRGLVLAVASKNNPEEAQLPFRSHPEMRLTLADFVAFEASWEPKTTALRKIAAELGLGLEALVFVDDNPAERERVRHELPQVGVVELPSDASGYVRALSLFPGLQSVGVTDEDTRRTQQYRARQASAEEWSHARSPEEFLAGLEMTATLEELSETNLTRIVQLIGKTNQLNLTGRRHTAGVVEAFASDPGTVVWGMRVSDRFDNHGLVAALIAAPDGDALVIDTFVMSCRVLGLTAEHTLLAALVEQAAERQLSRVVGHFAPSGRNAPAATILADAGFVLVPDNAPWAAGSPPEGSATWELVIGRDAVRSPGYVRLLNPTTARTSAQA